jgi:hypothetical protein
MLVPNYSVPYFGRDVKFNTYLRNHERCKTSKNGRKYKSPKELKFENNKQYVQHVFKKSRAL